MTKRKSTKSALITSVLALFLCFAMLLGSTFAWFTDSAASANNIIKSGNLDMKLSFKEYGAENTEWTEVKEDTVVFGKDALYEPGYTEAVWLKVENLGSLAFRYNLAINVLNEKEGVNRDGKSFKLSDYLEVKYLNATSTEMESDFYTTRESLNSFNFGGAANSGVASLKEDIAMINNGVAFSKNDAAMGDYSSSYVLVIISMPETVGNEACHNGTDIPEITFSLTAMATQLSYEEDSFGSSYDAGAEYPSLVDTWDGTADTSWYNDTDTEFVLDTAEELAGFVELANSGNKFSRKTIVLESDMDLNGEQWTPINSFAGTLDGNDHTIDNFSIDATTNHGGFINVLEWGTVKDLTLTGVTATVGDYRFGVLARSINQSNIDNVTVKDVNVTTTAPTAFVAGLFAHGTVNSNMEVNNCTVENLTVNAEAGANLIGGITTFVQKNGDEAKGTNIFENLNVKKFKVTVNDTDGVCGVGGLVGQTQTVWQNPRFNNCTVTGLDVTATGKVDVGGFICYPGSITFAENCTTEGKIDVTGVTSADNRAGGFFGNYGWGDNISKGDHKVTSCSAYVDITTKYASAGGFVGSGTNSEGKNKNITLTNCEANGIVTLVEGGTANIGGFAGETDRGIYINCSAAQTPFIGKVLDGYTLNDDGNGTLTVTK